MIPVENVSILVALFGGFLSFVSPCVLPLIPVFIAYVAGLSVEELATYRKGVGRKRIVISTAMFILGFTLIFTLMGASASFLGQLIAEYRVIVMKVAGVVIIIFGLHLAGVFKIKYLYREKRVDFTKMRFAGLFEPFLMGTAFTAGWIPCITPILAPILVYASQGETLIQGMLLLVVYSLGLGIPFFFTAIALNTFLYYFQRMKRYLGVVSVVSGLFLIIVGVLIFTDDFQRIASYFINLFPSG